MKKVIAALIVICFFLVIVDVIQDHLYKDLDKVFDQYRELCWKKDSLYNEQIRILCEELEECMDSTSHKHEVIKKEKIKQGGKI